MAKVTVNASLFSTSKWRSSFEKLFHHKFHYRMLKVSRNEKFSMDQKVSSSRFGDGGCTTTNFFVIWIVDCSLCGWKNSLSSRLIHHRCHFFAEKFHNNLTRKGWWNLNVDFRTFSRNLPSDYHERMLCISFNRSREWEDSRWQSSARNFFPSAKNFSFSSPECQQSSETQKNQINFPGLEANFSDLIMK